MSTAPDLWGQLVPGELNVERADGKPENLSLYMAVDDAHTPVPGCFIQVPPEFLRTPQEVSLLFSAGCAVWGPTTCGKRR